MTASSAARTASGSIGGQLGGAGCGVFGQNSQPPPGVYAPPDQWESDWNVYGALGAGHHGVHGFAPEKEESKFALMVAGRAGFSRSGLIAFVKGQIVAGKAMTGLYPGTMLLATLQTYSPGVYVSAAVAVPKTGVIDIYLNKKAPKTLKVAYFVLN